MTADLADASLIELFRTAAETQGQVLSKELLTLERDHADPKVLEALMRAAHSLKGAARIVGVEPAVEVAHAMESCFVAAQSGTLMLERRHVDILLEGVDLLEKIAQAPESGHQVSGYVARLNAAVE